MDRLRAFCATTLPIIAIFGSGLAIGSFAFRFWIISQGSTLPRLETGHVAEQPSRGEAIYVRVWEAALADFSLVGGGALFLSAGLAMQILFGRPSLLSLRGWQACAGFVAAAVFWIICITLSA